ncbi:MAG: biotin/lipoyl-containing protein [Dehalococcoidia bacterium]
MKVKIGEQEYDVQPGGDTVTIDGESYAVRVVRNQNIITVYVNEKPIAVQLPDQLPEEGPVSLLVDAKQYEVEVTGRAAKAKPRAAVRKSAAAATGAVTSQMTGRVTRVDVKPGDVVAEGDVLLVIEAMKMENEITAPVSGTVKDVTVNAGARVSEGDTLLVIEPVVE